MLPLKVGEASLKLKGEAGWTTEENLNPQAGLTGELAKKFVERFSDMDCFCHCCFINWRERETRFVVPLVDAFAG